MQATGPCRKTSAIIESFKSNAELRGRWRLLVELNGSKEERQWVSSPYEWTFKSLVCVSQVNIGLVVYNVHKWITCLFHPPKKASVNNWPLSRSITEKAFAAGESLVLPYLTCWYGVQFSPCPSTLALLHFRGEASYVWRSGDGIWSFHSGWNKSGNWVIIWRGVLREEIMIPYFGSRKLVMRNMDTERRLVPNSRLKIQSGTWCGQYRCLPVVAVPESDTPSIDVPSASTFPDS